MQLPVRRVVDGRILPVAVEGLDTVVAMAVPTTTAVVSEASAVVVLVAVELGGAGDANLVMC